MKRIFQNLPGTLAMFWVLNAQHSTAFAQTTTFTYQGRMESSGTAYSGTAEFQPSLWDAASDGSQVATNIPTTVLVNVTNGLFVLPLDFGNALFNAGAARWLELQVRTTLGPFTTLDPRQKLTPTPYAIHSASADVAGSAGAVAATNVTGVLSLAQLPDSLAYVNRSQTFTGTNIFNSGSRLIVVGTNGIHTSPFTGLGLQYSGGEGAIVSGGFLTFYTGQGLFGNLFRVMTIDTAGNVGIGANSPLARLDVRGNIYSSGSLGIGTSSPLAPLDVRGNIRLGSSGQYLATAGDENLRILRGMVNAAGAIVFGSGFTVSRSAAGTYNISFSSAFNSFPSVSATAVPGVGSVTFATVDDSITASGATVKSWAPGNLAAPVDSKFFFIAVGPR